MLKSTRILFGALLLAGPVALAQVSISPPTATTAPETPRPPSATMPTTTGPNSLLPTPQSVLESLINERPAAATVAEPSAPTTNPVLRPAVEATAPNAPKAIRIREGQFIWDRTGRLVKDDKTGTFLFAFDSDGKGMADPPLELLPSHMLMAMEDASDKGSRPVKFRISAKVTEYRGKNYLLVEAMKVVRDLNQGIGG